MYWLVLFYTMESDFGDSQYLKVSEGSLRHISFIKASETKLQKTKSRWVSAEAGGRRK